MVEIHAYHGWGFSSNFWDALKSEIPSDIIFKAADRGYYGSHFEPEFSHNVDFKILFTHSFGLHWCLASKINTSDVLVLFNGFGSFLPLDGFERKKALNILQRMYNKFSIEPDRVLTTFFDRCFFPEPKNTLPLSEYDKSLLEVDLRALENLSFKKITPNLHIISLFGEKDQIVSPEITKHMNMQIGVRHSKIFDGVGHALPAVKSSNCWSYLTEVLPIFAKYANKK